MSARSRCFPTESFDAALTLVIITQICGQKTSIGTTNFLMKIRLELFDPHVISLRHVKPATTGKLNYSMVLHGDTLVMDPYIRGSNIASKFAGGS